jgi:AcrR family transcriptional regulator
MRVGETVLLGKLGRDSAENEEIAMAQQPAAISESGSAAGPVRQEGAEPARQRSTRRVAPERTDVAEEGPRTRGGWVPVGTAAERREVHNRRGTARGERTRRQIIDAARRVFERDGYLDIGVADIAREAGVAHGSFYTYFESKLEVFRVVCTEVADAVAREVHQRPDEERGLDPVEALCHANRRYFRVYAENARIYALMEQLSHIDPSLTDTANGRRSQNLERITALIQRWQARGLADPEVEPRSTAAVLLSAISNTAYWLFAAPSNASDSTPEQALDAVNRAWIKTVDLRRKPNRRWLTAADS